MKLWAASGQLISVFSLLSACAAMFTLCRRNCLWFISFPFGAWDRIVIRFYRFLIIAVLVS